MPKFVVYEVWTRSKVVEAETEADAYSDNEPAATDDSMSLCNWHVVAVDQSFDDALANHLLPNGMGARR